MTDQYQCKSYIDDNQQVQDCTCGKCTTSTLFESAKKAVEAALQKPAHITPKRKGAYIADKLYTQEQVDSLMLQTRIDENERHLAALRAEPSDLNETIALPFVVRIDNLRRELAGLWEVNIQRKQKSNL